MPPEIYENIVNYTQLLILILYALRGLFRNTAKNVLSLILFPISLLAYVFLASYLGNNIIIPVSFFGVIKILVATIVIVTIVRFLISLIIGSFLKEQPNTNFFITILKRFPGAIVSSFEGALIIICIFWTIEYFDIVFLNKFEAAYKNIDNNHIYKAVSKINPIYDIKGSKDLKIAMITFSNEDYSRKFTESKYLQSFYELPLIKQMLNDTEFQSLLKEGKAHKIIIHPLIRDFLSNENIFDFVTSEIFIRECKASIPLNTLKKIESRGGFFSGLNFQLFKSSDKIDTSKNIKTNKTVKVILNNGFIFEGEIIERNQKGIKLKMDEGEMFFKVSEVLRVEKI